jgi:hypothetical protein
MKSISGKALCWNIQEIPTHERGLLDPLLEPFSGVGVEEFGRNKYSKMQVYQHKI